MKKGGIFKQILFLIAISLFTVSCCPEMFGPRNYQLTYDGNGNTGGSVPAAARYFEGVNVAVAGNTGSLAKIDFTFSGWNSQVNGLGSNFAVESHFPMSGSDLTLYAKWTPCGSVSLTFSLSTPNYHSITFSSSDISIARGSMLYISTTNTTLSSLSDWNWYIDNSQQISQTTSTFNWDTTGYQPGEYIINVSVVYQGIAYSGSLRVTVTY